MEKYKRNDPNKCEIKGLNDKEFIMEHMKTRGNASDNYGQRVNRIFIERTNEESVKKALEGKHFDVVIDKIAYCSNDIYRDVYESQTGANADFDEVKGGAN